MEDPACLAVKVPPDVAVKVRSRTCREPGWGGMLLEQCGACRQSAGSVCVCVCVCGTCPLTTGVASRKKRCEVGCVVHVEAHDPAGRLQVVIQLDLTAEAQGSTAAGTGAGTKNWHGGRVGRPLAVPGACSTQDLGTQELLQVLDIGATGELVTDQRTCSVTCPPCRPSHSANWPTHIAGAPASCAPGTATCASIPVLLGCFLLGWRASNRKSAQAFS
jgi:hypothetical protein